MATKSYEVSDDIHIHVHSDGSVARSVRRGGARDAEPYRASPLGDPIGQMERGSTAVGAGLRRVEGAPVGAYPLREAAPIITETVPEFRGTQSGLPASSAEEIYRRGAQYWADLRLSESDKQWLRTTFGGFGLGASSAQYQDAVRRHWNKDAEGRTFTEICKFAMPDEAGNAEAVSEIDGGARYQLRRDVGGGSSLHREVSSESVVAQTGDCGCDTRWPSSRRVNNRRLISDYGGEVRDLAAYQRQLNTHWRSR